MMKLCRDRGFCVFGESCSLKGIPKSEMMCPFSMLDIFHLMWICGDIVKERRREYEKFGDQSKLTQPELLAILTEEIGEYAHEVCEGIRKPFNRERAREELIQIAAVAVQIVEIIDNR